MALGDQPRLGQHHADSELGHRAGIASRCVDHLNTVRACRRHVDVDRATARYGNQLELRTALQQAGRDWRKVIDQHFGVADEGCHLQRVAQILFQALEIGVGGGLAVAVRHRRVGPVKLQRADVERRVGQRRVQCLAEKMRLHKVVADDGDAKLAHAMGPAGVMRAAVLRAAASWDHGARARAAISW